MQIQDFLKDTLHFNKIQMLEVRPKIVCKDGFMMSVQASRWHYCEPRTDLTNGDYHSVEVGFPSQIEDLLLPYIECDNNPTESIYAYVPIEVVEQVIIKHNGILKEE